MINMSTSKYKKYTNGDPNVLISGSSIRVSDHLGHRRGLRTLAALHAGSCPNRRSGRRTDRG